MFEHTQDIEWQQKRIEYWDGGDLYNLNTGNEYTKKQKQAFQDYFVWGDIEKLISDLKRMKMPLYIADVIEYGPFWNKEELDFNVTYYLNHYLPKVIDDGLTDLALAQKQFQNCLINFNSNLHEPFNGSPFAENMAINIFGNQFQSQVSYGTDFPLIETSSIPVNPNIMIKSLCGFFRTYLCRPSQFESYKVYETRIDYFVSLFECIDLYPFSLSKISQKDENARNFDYAPWVNQKVFRTFFAVLYGYEFDDASEDGDFGITDKNLQNDLRNKIEAINLGPEYEKFIDFIHRHKGKVLYAYEE